MNNFKEKLIEFEKSNLYLSESNDIFFISTYNAMKFIFIDLKMSISDFNKSLEINSNIKTLKSDIPKTSIINTY